MKIIRPKRPEAPLLPVQKPKPVAAPCDHVGDVMLPGDHQCHCGKWVTVPADGKIPHHMALERLSPRGVRLVRMRIVVALLYSAVYAEMQGDKGAATRRQPVRHVWFPGDDMAVYELRDGNPPADADRPQHLKGYRLEIDMGVIPEDVRREVKMQLKVAYTATAPPTTLDVMVREKGMRDALSRLKGPGALN